jgi:UPF0148 protein
MKEDEVLERITNLLEKGCTMLATHHECGAPLFRCQGEVVCPVCSFERNEALPAGNRLPSANPMSGRSSGLKGNTSDLEGNPSNLHSLAEGAGNLQDHALKRDQDLDAAKLRGVLMHKVVSLSDAIEVEQDLEKLERQIECVEALLRILAFLPR